MSDSILITGGCGFLGHHLVEHFLKNSDAEIVVLDKLTYASSGFDRLRDIEVFDHQRVKILGCDLSRPIPTGILREIGNPKYVIHAAAETHVDNSIVDPLPFLESNIIGSHHLFDAARGWGSERIFLISTDEVYGPAPWGHPGFEPGSAIRPTNPYAAAKAGAEALAWAYSNTYGLNINIVNGMNFFGERQHPEKFIPKVIRSVRTGEKVLIHADPARQLSGTRFYLHCRNFASALSFLISQPAIPKKVHVVGEREVSNLEMALKIAAIVGDQLKFELVDFHSSRPGHDLRYAMRDDFLEPRGWKRPMSFEASLEKTVRWYLEHPRWLALT